MAEAFAVYSADDNSLNFYKRDTVPTAGSIFEGKTATRVYTGVETTKYTPSSLPPWSDICPNITCVEFVDKITPVSTSCWFYQCGALTSLDLSGLDTSNVTNMSCMFVYCMALTSLDLSGFDTSNVTNMNGMFQACYSLTSLDLSSFDTSNVTNMNVMFQMCIALTSLDVSGFDTSNVTNMDGMFQTCSGLTSLDVSGFDTSNVADMSNMFRVCSGLTTIYVSKLWSTRGVTMSDGMFYGCTALVGAMAYDSSCLTHDYANYATGYLTYKKCIPLEYRDDFLVRGETMYDIAEAIREKTDSTDAIAVTDMAAQIAEITTGGGTEMYTNVVKNLLPCDAYIVYYNTATFRMTYATLAAGATGEYQCGTNFPLLILAKDDAYADFDISCIAGSIVPTSNRASWTMSSGDVFRGVMTVTFAPSVIEVGYFG